MALSEAPVVHYNLLVKSRMLANQRTRRLRTFTRRDFLKVSGAATLSLAFRLPQAEDKFPSQTPIGLGRVTRALQAYDQPSFSSKKLRVYGVDSVLNIYEEKTRDV